MSLLEKKIVDIGYTVHQLMKGERPSIFNRDFWQGKMMEVVMKDTSFKVDLFRFVDVLPLLQTTEEMAEHVREYLLKEDRTLPSAIQLALKSAAGGLGVSLATKAMRKNVTDMAERFIVGRDASEAQKVLQALHKEGFAFTVDLLGEATLSTKEALNYKERYMDLINVLAEKTVHWPHNPVIDSNHLGAIPRNNVSIKLSAMEPMLSALDHEGSVERLTECLLPVFLQAKNKGVFLNVDLEQWQLHAITYDVFKNLVLHPELRAWPYWGIVVQAYLKQSEADVQFLLDIAQKRGAPLSVRLVKGAYWDYEVVYAQQMGFVCPVFEDKASTDANYEKLSRLLLDNIEYLHPAFGSHNLRSLAHAMAYAEQKGISSHAYEIQMLYGMAEPERKAFQKLERRVRLYAPVGELLPGMAYLVRRLLENTSNSGFLRLSHEDNVNIDDLMKAPQMPSAKEEKLSREEEGKEEFINCSFTDFAQANKRRDFASSIHTVLLTLPQSVPVVIDGAPSHEGGGLWERENPNHRDQVVARVTCASVQQAHAAVASAYKAYPVWNQTSLKTRVQLLRDLADYLEAHRVELAALQCIEVAKPMGEADADVAEAIDFCRYYGQRALIELSPSRQGNVWGEVNALYYEGRGPTVIIAPWNFPLAILCGMSVAALVGGNPIIMKPAEQSSLIAYKLFQAMQSVGFPKEVVQFLPGKGEEIGPYLVEHPWVAQIAFTGSKSVGLDILARAGKTLPGQIQPKRVICEMGGKNAIIVDEDADMDEAVVGIIKSAFGYAGQKCSACSRVITVGKAHGLLVPRIIEAAGDLIQAAATEASSLLPPVVDKEAHERLLAAIEEGKQTAKALFIGETLHKNGYFVPPAIFEVTDIHHPLMQKEFFGPLVTILQVKTIEEAFKAANQTEFALTGAIFSRMPSHLERAKTAFRVGNLYLNRGSTGAMVDRQPFGGFHMSGAGTKAGGPGYLLNFVQSRVVTENTLRRGFTPELQ